MSSTKAVILFLVAAAHCITIAKGQSLRFDQKYIESVEKAQKISSLDSSAFGEQVDIATGSTSFQWTDIDIPGSSRLPVRLQRRLTIEDKFNAQTGDLGGFGVAGSFDIPFLKGVFPTSGWQVQGSTPNVRCSLYSPPPDQTIIKSSDYWNGNWMSVPWVGTYAILGSPSSTLPRPQGGASMITRNFWAFQCLPTTKNGYPGEAFLAISPEGDKYYFDWVVSKPYSSISKRFGNYAHSTSSMSRVVVYFLVTRIEDRFGNWVNYSYNGANLSRIEASDGRFIQISGWSGANVTSVVSSVGTWLYSYSGSTTTVTRPDGSTWRYAGTGELRIEPTPSLPLYSGGPGPGGLVQCPAPEPSSGNYSLAITHPAGATATYIFQVMRHWESNVPRLCNSFIDESLMSYRYLTIPNFSDSLTLVSKSINGPAVTAMSWTYSYQDAGFLAFEDVCANPPTALSCPQTRSTEIRGPEGSFQRHTFGKMRGINSGQLLMLEEGHEIGSTTPVIMKTTQYSYVIASELSTQMFLERLVRPAHRGSILCQCPRCAL
ncbi:hypothetical protein MUU75_16065 [Pseudoxanthomonas mexicana]|uniref:hypothetical protein n=1 Tax=Pseudoxanthomonas mexicana TaxID=128785 RepID=UPI001FD6BD41|nr:hypothetical protein [Pseudoxanthomonas mexicana]UOV04599.1 hypothetical protein MUU75_16065 [Pseudoxanthomonas mexicana]